MSGSYKILNFADQQEWRHCLQEVQAEDVFFSPEYLKCNEIILKGKAECFVYQKDDIKIIYPYILRQIEGTEYWDITSSYGFGGFIGWPRKSGINEFRKLFNLYCLDKKIVSEFIRFHPFYDNHEFINAENGSVINYQVIVYCPINSSVDYLAENLSKEVWKKVRKAIKNNIEVKKTNSDQHYQNFIDIYYETMTRLRAANFYFFPREFFFELKRMLPESLLLFSAFQEEKVIGGLLVVQGQDYSYNFLSGSKAAYHRLGLNDLVQYKVLEWAGAAGKKAHMLGGGMGGMDSLFQFKAKFSPWRLEYYLGKFIHLPEVYWQLCLQRSKAVNSEMQFSPIDLSWFPAYRNSFE